MSRSLRSWTDRALPWAAIALVGVGAEWSGYGWGAPSDWVPDLAAGGTLAACGLLARQQRPESRAGVLLVAAGLAWFAPNFLTNDWFAAHAVYLHRGPLVQLVLAYPRGRVTRRSDALPIVGAYAISVVPSVWGSPTATIALAAGAVLFAAGRFARSGGLERRLRLRALQATTFLGAALVLTAAMHLRGSGTTAALHVYQASVCALAIGLLVGLFRAPWERSDVTDLVVELGESRSGSLRAELARALGDPNLQVGYWLPDANGFVDGEGRPLSLPGTSSTQSTTFFERNGQRLAVLVHDRSIVNDPALVEAVSAAAGLAATNARLQAELRTRVRDVRSSRSRILAAADEERQRLERRLSLGAERRLDELPELLRGARAAVGGQTRARVVSAESRLEQTREELRRFARGIHPRELSERGLTAALEALARDFPLPVDLAVATTGASSAVDACAYFVCSEALANVAKYASASSVRIAVVPDGDGVMVEIADDGAGGADPDLGTGLRGLADRVETLGGTLTLDSRPGSGTTLRAVIPARA